MSVSSRDDAAEGVRLLPVEILGDEEITVFPDSAAVLDLGDRSLTVAATADDVSIDSDGLMFYGDRDNGGNGTQSLLYATWRRTEAVCYFATVVVLLVIFAFCVYFVFVMAVIRRTSSRASESGVRWTRLKQRQ